MYCDAVDGLFLKANGEIPCWCSPGEHHPLFRLDTDSKQNTLDIVDDVLNSRTMVEMRKALFHDRLPFDYCRGCGVLVKDQPDSWDCIDTGTFKIKELRMFHVESSYLCNIDCPLCIRLDVRKKSKDKPFLLPLWTYENVVDDLIRNRLSVRQLCFAGRGEPFMAPKLPGMVQYAREKLDCIINTHTNANFSFIDAYATCGFDEVCFSLDGVTQESYERYRRGGNLEKSVRFAGHFAVARKRLGLDRMLLIWKMVLFEWNSSDTEIRRAVEWAQELGMDRILLVNTDTPGGISYNDNGKRLGEIESLVTSLQEEFEILIQVVGFASIYNKLPEVEIQTRIDHECNNGRERTILLGRLFNNLLEDRSVHLKVEIHDESENAPREILHADLVLAERSELVDSMEIKAGDRGTGLNLVRSIVSDQSTGIVISETSSTL